jgi:hypothetical protein
MGVEDRLYALRNLLIRRSRMLLDAIQDEVPYFVCHFAGPLWTAFLVRECEYTLVGKGSLSLVEDRLGETERIDGICNGPVQDTNDRLSGGGREYRGRIYESYWRKIYRTAQAFLVRLRSVGSCRSGAAGDLIESEPRRI